MQLWTEVPMRIAFGEEALTNSFTQWIVEKNPLGIRRSDTDEAQLGKKVFKGKKMPGRMGGVQRTVKNVWVYKIDPARNLMWVKGQARF
ncbi:hypothetical protein MTR67_002720 [Solanum verrucosum]|uniref:Uncharacterized protein n=1 Tax=Solanum verrucosum TaxID=315347 RepID=A0AAF0PT06_SOLVR|nr:hypothetical protein MTR67_002720 [Solanum verrucosum]